MAETTDSFFDSNKLYLKSVQHEAVLRAANRNAHNDDPLYEEPNFASADKSGSSINKQMF